MKLLMWFWLSLKIQSIVVGVYAKGTPHRAMVAHRKICRGIIVPEMGLIKTINAAVSGVFCHMVCLEKDVIVQAAVSDMGFLWESE